jgi:hypothetical protein
MALPPNRFKMLLTGSDEEIYERLKREKCLSEEGLKSKERVLALLEKTTEEYSAWVQAHPGWTGASGVDRTEVALLSSPYVNRRAAELSKIEA